MLLAQYLCGHALVLRQWWSTVTGACRHSKVIAASLLATSCRCFGDLKRVGLFARHCDTFVQSPRLDTPCRPTVSLQMQTTEALSKANRSELSCGGRNWPEALATHATAALVTLVTSPCYRSGLELRPRRTRLESYKENLRCPGDGYLFLQLASASAPKQRMSQASRTPSHCLDWECVRPQCPRKVTPNSFPELREVSEGSQCVCVCE